MTPNVYDGEPDNRQATDTEPAQPVTRFRSRYRALTQYEKDLHDAIKAKADELDNLFDEIKDGRYKALARTALEESIMWIIKELTS